jgi:phage replication initiation protein
MTKSIHIKIDSAKLDNEKPIIDKKNVNYDELFFNYAEREKDDVPPYTNRGGNYPTTVLLTDPAANPPSQKFNCHIDYLSFTHRIPETVSLSKYMEEYFQKIVDMVPGASLNPTKRGYSGYSNLCQLTRDGLNIGLIAYGGNNYTVLTSLSGQGCVGVNMGLMYIFVSDLMAKLTRVDVAHDDLDGVFTVKKYQELYELGCFKNEHGGRNPIAKLHDDLGSNEGNTLQIGKKKNGKEVCIYEKGKQLGDKLSPWVRVEGRLTNEDRIVPYDILLTPGDYLAGMYQPFKDLSDKSTFIAIVKKHADIALKAMIDNASIAYGKLINLMSELAYTDTEIVKALIRDGIPKRVILPMDAWAAQYVEDDRTFTGSTPSWMAV